MVHIKRIDEMLDSQMRNERTTEYDGFEYKENIDEFNLEDSGLSSNEIDNFYDKKNKVLLDLYNLNIAKRGHRVVVYDDEIAVYGINVPLLADCREIAKNNNCQYKQDDMFDCFIFYLEIA